jgi:hypothetical protein
VAEKKKVIKTHLYCLKHQNGSRNKDETIDVRPLQHVRLQCGQSLERVAAIASSTDVEYSNQRETSSNIVSRSKIFFYIMY